MFLASLFSFSAYAEFCNWGYAGPKIHRCNGENYYYGIAACDSGIYQDIFCHERFNQNGRACAADNSPETMECYNRMVRPGRVEPRRDQDEGFCNWGWSGPQIVTCEGQRFCYGSAACRNGFYSNIFCKERYCQSGRQCADDNATVTVRCYNRFTQIQPPRRGVGAGQQEPKRGVR